MPSPIRTHHPRRTVSVRHLAAFTSLLTACGGSPGRRIDPRALDAFGLGNAAAALAVAEQMDAVAGGSPILGEAGGHGKAGKWSLALTSRRNGREAIDAPTAPLKVGSETRPASMPRRTEASAHQSMAVAASLGVLSGFAVEGTRVLSVDLLGGVTWVGGAPRTTLNVNNGGIARTIGWRLGILRETPKLPGLAVSWSRTVLPSVSIDPGPLGLGEGEGEVLLRVNGLTPTMSTRRVTFGKQFGHVGVSASLGRNTVVETHDASVKIMPNSGPDVSEVSLGSVGLERTSVVVGTSYDLGALVLGAEVGQMRGGFDPAAIAAAAATRRLPSRTFVTIGARIGSN